MRVIFKSFTFRVHSMPSKLIPSTVTILLCRVTIKRALIDLYAQISGVGQ